MARLILILMALAALWAFWTSLTRVAHSAVHHSQEASVPRTAKTISYLLLIMLMFGVVTGWFGGL